MRHLKIVYIVLIFLQLLDDLMRGHFTSNTYSLNEMDFARTVNVHSNSYPLISSVTQLLDERNKTGISPQKVSLPPSYPHAMNNSIKKKMVRHLRDREVIIVNAL